MDSIKIIGITGRKFSGKDTAGSYFVEKYGFRRIAYAGPLKKACMDIFDLDSEQCYGDKKEVVDEYWGVTPRKIFQFVGTDLFRKHIGELLPEVGSDIWVCALKRWIMRGLEKDPSAKFVVTDIRFPNELEAIKQLGGVTIKMVRDGLLVDNHESEILIDGLETDFVLDNNGTKKDLHALIEKMI